MTLNNELDTNSLFKKSVITNKYKDIRTCGKKLQKFKKKIDQYSPQPPKKQQFGGFSHPT